MEGQARQANYSSGLNLAKRQALFAFVDVERSVGAAPLDLMEWSGREQVLDAGCGNGMWSKTLADRFGVRAITGLDLSAGMLKDARTDIGAAVPLAAGDVQALPFADHRFDVVLCFWMLYHVPDHSAAVAEFHRVLRPGGHLLATTNSSVRRSLDLVFAQALSHVTGAAVSWPPGFSFSAENGQAILETSFPMVRAAPRVTAFAVPQPEPLLESLDSVRGPAEAYVGSRLDWPAVRAEAQKMILGIIQRDGVFRNEMVSMSFIASKSAD